MLNTNMSQEWLKAATVDLEVIKAIISNDNLTTMTAFHSQQSIEKCLKALLELNNQEVPKVDNIKKLLNMTNKYIILELDIDLIIKIDTLYIESRYPGWDFYLTENQCSKMLKNFIVHQNMCLKK